MRKIFFSLLFFIPQFCASIFAQNPYIRHYTTHDGLPSNTIYQMCQDRHKFLWFTSDAGVAKFDGTSFTIYRKKDGLSSNDVVRIKEDSKGRVWFFNYNGTVNYYFNNKIYNGGNSPFLNFLIGKGFLLDFFTDSNQTINFYNWEGEVFALDKNNKVTKGMLLERINTSILFGTNEKMRVSYLSKNNSNEWMIWTHRGIFSQHDQNENAQIFNSRIFSRLVFPVKNNICYCVPHGLKNVIFKVTSDWEIEEIQYQGNAQKIRTILEDSEGNVWIAALDEGVYCLKNNKVFIHFDIKNALGLLQDHEENIWVSTQSDGIYAINHNILTQNHFDRTYFNNSGVNLLCNYPGKGIWCLNSEEVFLLGTDAFFYKLAVPNTIQPLDVIHFFDNKTLLLGTKIAGLCMFESILLNKSARQISYGKRTCFPTPMKKIINDRNGLTTILDTRRVFFNQSPTHLLNSEFDNISEQINNAYYNAGNEFVINGKRNYIYRKNRLEPYTELSRFDGTIISNHLFLNDSVELFNIDGDSLFLLKDHIFYNLTKAFIAPISLQIKKALYKDSTLYLSTLKDIFVCYNPMRIIKGSQVKIKPLNISFNNINDILINNDSLFIASDDGLTIIPESSLLKNIAPPPIPYFHSITVNDKIYSLPLKELILTGKNNIQLSFGCISYFSSQAVYSYMLEGAGNKWITGNGSDINLFYRNLPPGKYNFRLRVRKSDSGWSKPLVLAVIIRPTMVEYPAFWAILVLIAGALILFIVFRIKSERIKRIEIDHQLVVLEQKALQSMMNPHFIFNSLGSIQNYLLKNKESEAIIYLSNFARLIRQNLNAVNTPMILLQEEVERLTNYLDLEKIRLENKFDFNIEIDPELEEDEVYIPGMIIQPIVENSIWHGIASLKEQGKIAISFHPHTSKSLVIRIEDNGIGMKQSNEDSNNDPHRKHLGMQIIKKRLYLLGKKYTTETSINYSGSSVAGINTGTLAVLVVPFTYTISEL